MKEEIVYFIKNNNSRTSVHTFGIGEKCDERFIRRAATAGRGSFSLADRNYADLSGQVVQALYKAS